MDAIMELARKHGLKVVEDCAHAHGGMWDGKGLGSIGHIGSFSFQQSKTVAAGEGGAVITNDDGLWERLYRFKHIGYPPHARQGESKETPPAGLVCRNYRATEFQGITICPQLEKLEELTLRRNKNADILTRYLSEVPGISVQQRGRKATAGRQSYYNFIIQYDPEVWSNLPHTCLIQAIRAEGLQISATYGTVYRHPLWNVAPEQYRIHGGWSDQIGRGCQVSEEIGTLRSFGFNHRFLDLPEEDLIKIAELFQKLYTQASLLKI